MVKRDYPFLDELVRGKFKIRSYGNYKSLIRCRVLRVLKTLVFQESYFKVVTAATPLLPDIDLL